MLSRFTSDGALGNIYGFSYVVTQIWNEDEIKKSSFHPDIDRLKPNSPPNVAVYMEKTTALDQLGLEYPLQIK